MNPFACTSRHFSSQKDSAIWPRRVVFADPQDNGKPKEQQQSEPSESEKNEKKETVNFVNARQTIFKLAEKKKIDDAAVSRALNILEHGEESDRKKLLSFLQDGVDGKLNPSKWKSFLAEAEAKITPATVEDGEKSESKADGDELKFDIKKKITLQAGEALQSSKKAQGAAAVQTPKSKEFAAQISGFKSGFENLLYRSRQTAEPAQEQLQKMLKEGHLTPELGQKLYRIDFLEDNANEEWLKATKDVKDPKAKAALDYLLELKRREAEKDRELEREFEEKMKKFREMNNQIGEELILKANRKRSLENLFEGTGLPIKPGQVLVYDDLETDPQAKRRNKKKKATIKDVRFEDIEIKDENGKVIQKKPSDTPTVYIESIDPETKKYSVKPMHGPDLSKWVEAQDVTEDLENQKDLERSIGQSLNKGDKFEFRELFGVTDQARSTQDTAVEIKNINPASKLIELDKKVLTRPDSGVRTDVLTFGQFARWFKKNEVVRPIENLEKLQTELRAHNEVLNSVYERNPAEYPAIEGKVGEILYFDDDSGRDFVIREINAKKVVIDNNSPKGLTFTPAAFLRWVKKNEVEKRTPEAEALKASRNLSGDEKEKKEAEVRQKVEEENKERREQKPPEEDEETPVDEEGEPIKKIIYRPEERAQPSSSAWRQLWSNTSIASLSDLWEIGNFGVEFAKRKLTRWQKGKVGVIGEKMFGWYRQLGSEFKSHAQSAENEEVNHHADVFRTMDPAYLREKLRDTNDKDVIKALITVLTEKGYMRWDDHLFWENVDKISGNSPESVVASTDYMGSLEKVIDGWWGPDTFREFRNKQDSSYNSIKNGFKDNATRLENDPLQNGGLKGALQNLLYKHMNGQFVNPAEYEEYLDFALENGKLTFGDKVFFLIMGVAAQPPGQEGNPGSTLLHIDRVAAIEGTRLNNFPMLDFFTKKIQDIDENGQPLWNEDGTQRRVSPTLRHFRHWMKEICEKDMPGGSFANVTNFKELTYGDHLVHFMEHRMVWDDATRTRLEKSASDVTRYDHDDMQYFVAMMSEELVEQITKKSGGARQQMSNEGIKNAFAGLNHFIKLKMDSMRDHLAQGEKGKALARRDLRQLMNLIRTFIRLDAIIDRRIHHHTGDYTRFSEQETDNAPGADSSRPVREHIAEVRLFIKSLAREFHLEKEFQLMSKEAAPQNEQTPQQSMVLEFGGMLEGKMYNKSEQELAELFKSIQDQHEKEGTNIKGMIAKLTNKAQIDRIEKTRNSLRPYRAEEINEKVKSIASLKEELQTLGPKASRPETVATERRQRLQDIIKQIESGSYEFIEGDSEILDREVQRLKREVDGLKGRFDTAYEQMAANDNGTSWRQAA